MVVFLLFNSINGTLFDGWDGWLFCAGYFPASDDHRHIHTSLGAAHRMKDLGAGWENFTFVGWDLAVALFSFSFFIQH
jgi:hypothetical protein